VELVAGKLLFASLLTLTNQISNKCCIVWLYGWWVRNYWVCVC